MIRKLQDLLENIVISNLKNENTGYFVSTILFPQNELQELFE